MSRILIIDDNSEITRLLVSILKHREHDVYFTNNFEEGISILKNNYFDVIFLDAPMPKYEKITVLDSLEKQGVMKSQKIILFTALEIPDSLIEEWMKKGLYSYIRKPVQVDQILRIIGKIPKTTNEELTKERSSGFATKKTLEDLRIDISSLKAKLGSIDTT